jgi:hypothetical protein
MTCREPVLIVSGQRGLPGVHLLPIQRPADAETRGHGRVVLILSLALAQDCSAAVGGRDR